MASITSVELNYIIFRYLQESGFTHTAFTFGFEAGINKSPIDGNLVPPATLVKLIQKGLQYMEMEANLSNAKNDVDEEFSLLQPMDLITKDVHELQKIVTDKKKSQQLAGAAKLDRENGGGHSHVKDKTRKDREKQGQDMDKEGKDRVVRGAKRTNAVRGSNQLRN